MTRNQAAAGGSAEKRDLYDAITLDARLRYYTALARTRALTEAEDEDRLHLLRCRVLRRLLPVRVAAGPAIGHGRHEGIPKPRSLLSEFGRDLTGVFDGLPDKPCDLLVRHSAAVDLVLEKPGNDGQRECTCKCWMFSHAVHFAPARAIGQ